MGEFSLRFIKKDSRGFSLVELAISVTVVGLLLAAVVKGGEVLDNARVATTLSRVKSYETAMLAFKDLYGGYAGDLANARDAVPGCASNVDCVDGDGDGKIQDRYGASNLNPSWDYSMIVGTSGPTPEGYYTWKQLALAEMIDGIDVNTTAQGGSSSIGGFGRGYPKSPLGGGFSVFYDSDFRPDNYNAGMSGHFFRLFTGGFASGQSTDGIVKPMMAAALDRKIDDGLPYSGRVTSGSDANCLNDEGRSTATYNAASNEKACMMFFKFGGRRG